MSVKHQLLAERLTDLESLMRELSLWSALSPTEAALASRQPFAVDTLAFEEWLQFIFLPRMQQLLESSGELPTASGIAPMAEEYFRIQQRDVVRLIELLASIDRLLSVPVDDKNL